MADYYEVNFEGDVHEPGQGGADILVWGWASHEDAFAWALPLLGKTLSQVDAAAERELLPTDPLGNDIPMTRFTVRAMKVRDFPRAHDIVAETTTKLRES